MPRKIFILFFGGWFLLSTSSPVVWSSGGVSSGNFNSPLFYPAPASSLLKLRMLFTVLDHTGVGRTMIQPGSFLSQVMTLDLDQEMVQMALSPAIEHLSPLVLDRTLARLNEKGRISIREARELESTFAQAQQAAGEVIKGKVKDLDGEALEMGVPTLEVRANEMAALSVLYGEDAKKGYDRIQSKIDHLRQVQTQVLAQALEKGEQMGRELQAAPIPQLSQGFLFNRKLSWLQRGLVEWQRVLSGGMGISRRKLGTTIYYQPQDKPMKGFEEVSEDAKAVIIAFGGSGTTTSSGITFMRDAPVYNYYGVSVISFDYPFHASGPREFGYKRSEESKKLFFRIVKHYRKTGKPLFLMGHSFGPLVIQELRHDSPTIARGGIMLSPGGEVSPNLGRWYRHLVASGAMLKFAKENDVVWNPQGEEWESYMAAGFKSNKGILQRNGFPVFLMAGDQDIWNNAPGLIQDFISRYPQGTYEVWPGVGHGTIFQTKGRHERLVTEKVLNFISEQTGIKFTERQRNDSPTTKFRYYYHN
ncbi:MAG: alpha/beta hydrolase, partial [Elusimicrobia bacterium]|nr:alpha/beta hydrolase [Elusimicrobiota bacterium]